MNTFIFISINEKRFVIDPNHIKEIIKVPNIYGVPNVKEEIIGIINYKGTPIPVFNISNYFDLDKSHKEYKYEKIIVVNIMNENIGILIDKIYKIGEVKKDDLLDKMDYSSLVEKSVAKKVKELSNDIYFIKIIGDAESEMIFLRFIISIDILKNAGEILASSIPIEDIENDNIRQNGLLILFAPADTNSIELLMAEISKVTDIVKTDLLKIIDKQNYKNEIESYFNKSQNDITLFEIEQLEKKLKERFEIGK